MEKRKYKKSLKRKIQNSLMASSFLSIAISLIAVWILIMAVVHPVGKFITGTINNGIYDDFIKIQNKAAEFQKFNDFEIYRGLSYETLKSIDINNKGIFDSSDDLHNIDFELSDLFSNELVVLGDSETGAIISEDEKRAIIISTINSVENFDESIPLGDFFGFDIVNVTFILNDEVEFIKPSIEDNYIPGEKLSDIDNVMIIYDKDNNPIGEIKTSLNEGLLMMIIVPVILLFILIALLTFIIVKILLMPFMHSILKPIKNLNFQLKKISEDELCLSNVTIEQRKPPKEIYQLINYSNIIMAKLQDSQQLMYAQNQELEAQRDELESQRDELESQNDELDVQNHDLLESQLQLKKAQDRLVQSEKLASMGQLTAAIAHEINTPLGAVSSNIQMIDMMLLKLEKNLNNQEYDSALKIVTKLEKSNKISLDAANRVNEIIRNLRNFSRIDQAEFQNANVNEGIQSVLVLTSNLWKNKVTLNEEYGIIPEISCYPSMLNQVFMNVIVNAIQATEKNGTINIKTYETNQNIVIEIKDDGIGVKKEFIDKIFESGFTTKPKDAGTGLGLSISRDIILKHHGSIRALNNEDKGTTFIIELPKEQPKHDEECEHD